MTIPDRLALARAVLVAVSLLLLGAYTAAAAASPIRQLTNTPGTNVRPAWSPDGAQIAFQSNRDGPYHVYVMNADGSDVRRLTSGGADDRHPAWSPDARYLAVDSGDSRTREIWLIEVATGARRQLTTLGGIASFPSWSPDGRQIGFYVYREGVMDVWLMGQDGGGVSRLTQDLASEKNQQCTFACHSVAWSPDSGRVAFSDGQHARVLLAAALAGGSAPTAITPEGERSHFPVFLADGRLVYVTEHVSTQQSYTDLWTQSPDAGAERQALAEGVQAQGPFAVRSDGAELLFASPRDGNFEIYAVTLDEAGKAALAQRPQRAGEFVDGPVSPGAQPAASGPTLPEGWPYLAGLGVVALLLGGIELAYRRSRRSRAGH
ncbi:MAG: TolB family protein [Candidatus Limnocylindria bacterium]